MTPRVVIFTAETLARLLQDYLGEENIPLEAKLVGMRYRQDLQGRIELTLESPDFKPDPKTDEFMVQFQLRKAFSLGGTTPKVQ